jgi:hypothetical protein
VHTETAAIAPASDHFFGGEIGRFLPTLTTILPFESSATMRRSSYRCGDLFDAGRKCRGADNHAVSALIDQAARDPVRRRRHAAASLPRDEFHQRRILALAHGRIQTDHPNFGNAANLCSISSGASPSRALSRP